MPRRRFLAAVALGLVAAGPAGAAPAGLAPDRYRDEPLLVFAAASLADALTEVGDAWQRSGRPRPDFNFAGSNTLAQQIAAGAPADLFVSADEAQMARAVAAGRVRSGAVVELLSNRLVVVVPADRAGRLTAAADLLAFPRVALADPEGVPAGVYARRWLERQGLWERLAPRVVPALDVRAALAAVAAGHLPAGVVYETDAATTDRVTVAYRVPEEEAPPVRYLAAPLRGRRESEARDLLRFLTGAEAAAVFSRHGFTPAVPSP